MKYRMTCSYKKKKKKKMNRVAYCLHNFNVFSLQRDACIANLLNRDYAFSYKSGRGL